MKKIAETNKSVAGELAKKLVEDWGAKYVNKGASNVAPNKELPKLAKVSSAAASSSAAAAPAAGKGVASQSAPDDEDGGRAAVKRAKTDAVDTPGGASTSGAWPGEETLEQPSDPKQKRMCKLMQETFDKDADKFSEEVRAMRSLQIVKVLVEVCGGVMTGAPGKLGKMKEAAPVPAVEEAIKAKFMSLKHNLSKNEALRTNVLEGSLTPQELVKLTPEQLASAERRQQVAKAVSHVADSKRSDWMEANRDEVNRQAGIETKEGMFKCVRCGSKKTSHYQKQTRSADEPMTVFVTCLDCRHKWRF